MMEEYPIQNNDYEMIIGAEEQEPLPLDMPKVDFLGGEGGLFGDDAGVEQSTGLNILKKGQNKKQVQAIRQAMMKHDKKIQRQIVGRVYQNPNDDDDIVRNMTNLILHKNDEGVKPW